MNALQLSANDFRTLATRATELASDYLVELDDLRTFPEVSGEATRRAFAAALPEKGLGPAAFDALAEVLNLSRPPSPRFFGYVHGSGEPVAAIADLLASEGRADFPRAWLRHKGLDWAVELLEPAAVPDAAPALEETGS